MSIPLADWARWHREKRAELDRIAEARGLGINQRVAAEDFAARAVRAARHPRESGDAVQGAPC